jgi:hypothetical protein
MKKSVVAVVFLLGLLVSTEAFAENEQQGQMAIGAHGIGSQWNYGQPMVRWNKTEELAIDFTPIISERNGGGSGKSKSETYGLNVGIVKRHRMPGGLSLGWRVELGYDYTSSGSEYTSGSYSSSYHDRYQHIDLGVGPDLEYFVQSIPGLSVGAYSQIHYRYTIDNYHSSNSSFIPAESQSNSYVSQVDLMGELLVVRYYF